jgi:hypothetical protein
MKVVQTAELLTTELFCFPLPKVGGIVLQHPRNASQKKKKKPECGKRTKTEPPVFLPFVILQTN